MKKKTVIIPVETKAREFHGKLFLALHLLRRGHPVLFGEQRTLWTQCDLIEPGIYLDKSVAATRVDRFRACRALGHEVVSWDEEGLVFFDNWLYRKQRIAPEAFDLVSRFFAWGEVQREAICEEYPQYRERISVCGNPRFDLLRPDLREFYRPAVERLKQRFGPMLLINTNFAFCNHFKPPEEVRVMLAKYPIANEPGYMEKWIGMHREMHEAYLKMTPDVLTRFPDHAVVVRPHPSENHGPWLELARSHPRLHVDASGNVHEWILASEAVIHFNCTTAVEAYLLGVPAIAYRPARYPRYENHLPNALSENAFSLPALLDVLAARKTARERGALWTPEQQETAARYISGLSGKTAAERISEEISAISDRLPQARFGLAQRTLNQVKRQWRPRLQRLRELRHPPDGYARQKFPALDASEMREALAGMMATAGFSTGYTLHPLASNCFRLDPRDVDAGRA